MALHVSQTHPRTMGLTITASHNPRNYVGVKFTVPGVRAIGLDCGPGGGLRRIREIYHHEKRPAAAFGGSVSWLNLTREYIDYSMRHVGIGAGQLSGIRVVLDTMNGSAGPELLAGLDAAGVSVESVRTQPDGHFPSGSPNPISRGKMDNAIRLAGQKNCQVAIGVDGDGDRLVFGDRRGILSAGFVAIPILKISGFDGSQLGRPGVLYDPKVNPQALAEWSRLDVRPVLFRNGHSQIKDYMLQVGAMAAVEESGHYYHFMAMGGVNMACENSLVTILLFLRALKEYPAMLDELWACQREVQTTGEFNYQFDDDATRDQAMAAVVDHFHNEGATATTVAQEGIDLGGAMLRRGVSMDAFSVKLETGWYSGFLRAATNEKSIVRSYFSSADAAQLARIEADVRRILAQQFAGTVVD